MKHLFNEKVLLYYVCNYDEFKKVSVSLGKLKTSLFVSAQRRDLFFHARLWRFNRQRNRLRPLEKYMP